MKNRLKRIVISLLIFNLMLFSLIGGPTYGDYGDFESYDSGSSSDWDYDDDDDWDSSSSSSSYHSSSSSGGSTFGAVVFLIIIIIYALYSKYGKKITPQQPIQSRVNPFDPNREANVLSQVKETDKLFNRDDFVSWAGDLFVKLQYAWSDRDLETIRSFETPELFEQSATQINRYIANKQINKLERVSVNKCRLYEFSQSGDKESLSVILESKMIDYIIDETSGNVIRGDKNANKVNAYVLTFVRAKGTKTTSSGDKLKTTNCPNCGAPTTITSSGKCEYCGSVITIDNHDNWSLASLKKYNPNM